MKLQNAFYVAQNLGRKGTFFFFSGGHWWEGEGWTRGSRRSFPTVMILGFCNLIHKETTQFMETHQKYHCFGLNPTLQSFSLCQSPAPFLPQPTLQTLGEAFPLLTARLQPRGWLPLPEVLGHDHCFTSVQMLSKC